MSSDTGKHHELVRALREGEGKGDGSFERAVTRAFEHVFEHLDRLNTHVSASGPGGEDRPLEAGETPSLR